MLIARLTEKKEFFSFSHEFNQTLSSAITKDKKINKQKE
jgi:hypothetical protein